jgi:F0F1-type ATP synthase assembly protein I
MAGEIAAVSVTLITMVMVGMVLGALLLKVQGGEG